MTFLYIIAAIAALILFLPAPGTTEIRNVPILIAVLSLVAVYWIYKFVRMAICLHKTKALLEKRRFKIESIRMFPFGIVAIGKDATYNILLVSRRKRGVQYHFCDGNTIVFYRASGNVYRRGVINMHVKKVGKKILKWPDVRTSNAVRILVIDKFPYKITKVRGECELGNGDSVDGVYLYDWKGFSNFINTIR